MSWRDASCGSPTSTTIGPGCAKPRDARPARDASRRTPLTAEQIASYRRDGYLAPLDLLTPEETAFLRTGILQHLSGAFGTGLYELTDRIDIRCVVQPDTEPIYVFETGGGETRVHTFPFLFNLWRTDDRFLRLATAETFARVARQLLMTDAVLLFEDNVVVKQPGAKYLPWHQDYAYWPLGEPRALTFWFALDRIDASNGAMEVAPGTHLFGERLPVAFGSEEPFMAQARPGIPRVPPDPRSEGYKTITYDLAPGQCGIHHGLTWHGSTPNAGDTPRFAYVLRYIAEYTLWLGETRIPYDDIGVPPGHPVTRDHLPLAGASD